MHRWNNRKKTMRPNNITYQCTKKSTSASIHKWPQWSRWLLFHLSLSVCLRFFRSFFFLIHISVHLHVTLFPSHADTLTRYRSLLPQLITSDGIFVASATKRKEEKKTKCLIQNFCIWLFYLSRWTLHWVNAKYISRQVSWDNKEISSHLEWQSKWKWCIFFNKRIFESIYHASPSNLINFPQSMVRNVKMNDELVIVSPFLTTQQVTSVHLLSLDRYSHSIR